jgi:predicted GIY-YIG superfamily endonuclease
MTYSVYVFLDAKNRPYYVGKTNNMTRRRKDHLYEVKTGNTLPKYVKARKLFGQGQPLKMRRIRSTNNEKEAYRLERQYIKKYRNMGYVLMNCTYGGPDELPMKINKVSKLRKTGIKLPTVKKRIVSAVGGKKKRKKITKIRKRR